MQTKMTEPTRGVRALILAAIVLCITVSLTGAKAGQDKNTTLRVALVDIERLSGEYSYNINAVQELQKQAILKETVLRTLAQHALLSEADQKTLSDLVTAESANPNSLTPAQKTQKQQITDKSKAMSEEFLGLQQKVVGQLTPQDKEKLNQYFRAQNETEQRLRKSQSDSEESLKGEAVKNRTKAVKDVRDAIAKTAKEKGFALVLSNEFAWYAEGDITDDVLKVLNKK
jgi:Skp family chaperone for outer membrane proteins